VQGVASSNPAAPTIQIQDSGAVLLKSLALDVRRLPNIFLTGAIKSRFKTAYMPSPAVASN
jgi:hypothetical protein